jgi:dolichol-phosphate mannosyltransferase
MRQYSVSLAAPAYNEAEGIRSVIAEWSSYLQAASFLSDYEIVICSDGSKDGTGEILNALAAEDYHLVPVLLDKNQGAGAALSKAIACTRMDWVLLIDSDGQFPVSFLEKMLEIVDAGSVAVIGVREHKLDSPFSRFGTFASATLCNFFLGTHYADFNSAFKLVHGPLLRSLTLEAKGLNYSTDVTAKLAERKVSLTEIQVRHLRRVTGKSSLRIFRDVLHRLLFVLYIGFRQFLFKIKVLQRPGGQ